MAFIICEQRCQFKNNIAKKLQAQQSNLRTANYRKLSATSGSAKGVTTLATYDISTGRQENTFKGAWAHDLVIPMAHAKLHPDYIGTNKLNQSRRNLDFCQ